MPILAVVTTAVLFVSLAILFFVADALVEPGDFACPDAAIPLCLHRYTTPVESAVLGAPVAELCLICDEQMPVPWPEGVS